MFDVCIIGGGMSGLTAALTAGGHGLKTIVIDKNAKLARKIYATGNGRCNLSNEYFDFRECYNSLSPEYPVFLAEVFKEEPNKIIEELAKKIGIGLYNDNSYIYPLSNQASAFVWAMLDSLMSNGIRTVLKQEIRQIKRTDGYFTIDLGNEPIKAKNVVLACGSNAYPKLGGGMSGYMLAESFGHTINKVRPSLTALLTREKLTDLSGVRAKASAALYIDGKMAALEKGELQITDYGISGIMIFNLSSKAGRALEAGCSVFVEIDFLDDISARDLIINMETLAERTAAGFLNGYVNDKIAVYAAGGLSKVKISELTGRQKEKILNRLKHFRVEITGLKDYDMAQVCAGGVQISEVWPTCESKLCRGLYITGELLDIDGKCGGYNLSFAAATGKRAGEDIYDKVK